MSARKRYGDTRNYEDKLNRVMARLGVTAFEYNWDRWAAWVQFTYKNEIYQFEHSVRKAQERGLKLQLGSDCFAQLVLSLEDLARMVERGIYDLSTWVAGMKYLPPAVQVPTFFTQMGFDRIPTFDECRERYRELAKQLHPDAGGEPEDFKALRDAWAKAQVWFGEECGQ